VATGNVAHQFSRFQFGYGIEEFATELVIESDFQRPVLVQDLTTSHRFSKSFLDEKAICRKLENFALVGACCRNGARFALDGDQLLALPADVIRLAGQPMAMGDQHLIHRVIVRINDLAGQAQCCQTFACVAPEKEREDKNRGTQSEEQRGHRGNHQRMPSSDCTGLALTVTTIGSFGRKMRSTNAVVGCWILFAIRVGSVDASGW
jgi:hypothetical protein